ncbi:hypothetical protein PR202_ga29183 [Eleusine coracana subsp. coracana]|uniref:Uncharacterized protein n=1 Tax=Eleusine coracana subsp. coracana TaxID=191504 RepID=A0AAV5DLH3_ELECO|nr:hypothetical protein PR202_ga29183 [Eleusine coracana subsp. coracana]
MGQPMPRLHNPKRMPIFFFVHKPDVDKKHDWNLYGTSVFIMERIPELEVGCCTEKYSDQFEVFATRSLIMTTYNKTWKCLQLPPPPYIREPKYFRGSCPEISSYAVLDGGAQVCVSVDGVGTYSLDTQNHTWIEVGKWTLPYRGKVEYVPELKLWLGFSAKNRHLAAADLSGISTMNSQPQLMDLGKEFDTPDPDEWKECKDSQLVNLGSGMFCVARFFRSRTLNGDFVGDESITSDQDLAVFTGLEVVPRVLDANGNDGKVGLQMTPHTSRCHTSNNGTAIGSVF